jgi:hypothetical protein
MPTRRATSQFNRVTQRRIRSLTGDAASDPKFKQLIRDAVYNGSLSVDDRVVPARLLVERGHPSLPQTNEDIDK